MFGLSKKSRVIIVSTLAALSLLLGILAVVLAPRTAAGREAPKKSVPVAIPGEIEIRRGLEAVCADFHVPPASLRVHDLKDRTGQQVRTEYRLRLPRDFSAAEFNLALSRKVEPWGAHVMGTERTHDRTVTLHVIRDEETIMSVILDMNEPTNAGKAHGK